VLSNGSKLLADLAIEGFKVNQDKVEESVFRNPILVTALNPIIGYELGAKIAKQAYSEKRSVLDVAKENTDLTEDEILKLLDPIKLTQGGIEK